MPSPSRAVTIPIAGLPVYTVKSAKEFSTGSQASVLLKLRYAGPEASYDVNELAQLMRVGRVWRVVKPADPLDPTATANAIRDLRQKRVNLLATYLPGSKEIRVIDAQIAALIKWPASQVPGQRIVTPISKIFDFLSPPTAHLVNPA